MENEQCDGRELRFVFEYEQGHRSMTELCHAMRSRGRTGYVWIRGIASVGWTDWWSRVERAWRHGNHTPGAIEGMVLELRQAHTRWGPRKLKRVLEREEPGRVWPARVRSERC